MEVLKEGMILGRREPWWVLSQRSSQSDRSRHMALPGHRIKGTMDVREEEHLHGQHLYSTEGKSRFIQCCRHTGTPVMEGG